jgi:hypothetical protein
VFPNVTPRTPRSGSGVETKNHRRPHYGGRDGDTGIVYLDADTLRELKEANVELREGLQPMLSDFDGTPEEPTWLVVDGVLSFDKAANQWLFRYPRAEVRCEPRAEED